ncbi:DUF2771 domain-containing protein [Corynebacterium tuscaniense]|uniref:DUF2771 domain-containing protein n=1 Tax=Corynebacterium tuscaniense TaxID=302449 RepID=UPI00050E1852|nr:DUF2771 domain-containing protein [Corynebacterium tuscaniense]KGF20923.1 hypothetical protein HMPREF2129_09825 [Corynebacterium tuscaniense DNF00037]
MGSKKTRDQRSIAMLAIIAVMIVGIVAALYFYMEWRNNRPSTPPQEIEVTATAGENSATTTPFSVCEFGENCPEGSVATIDADGADAVRVSVPKDVSVLQWSLLSIYDDPAANSERTFTPGEADEVDVPIRSESNSNASLVVMEVSCLMVGQDGAGEETPVMVTWAFSTEAA